MSNENFPDPDADAVREQVRAAVERLRERLSATLETEQDTDREPPLFQPGIPLDPTQEP